MSRARTLLQHPAILFLLQMPFLVPVLAPAWLAPPARAADPGELVYLNEGNRLHRFDVDTLGDPVVARDILIQRAGDGGEGGGGGSAINGRDVNGMVCPLPDGSGRFVAGEDTGQPSPPAGWGVFAPDGTQVGKLTATYPTELPGVPDNPEPFGCAFDSEGTLFTVETGTQGIGPGNGQLIMWFPPYDRFPGPPGAYPETDARSDHFCKIAVDIGTATGIAIDADDNVYVSSGGLLQIQKFAPPFPTGTGPGEGCEAVDPVNGSPMAEVVNRSVLVQGTLVVEKFNTFTGLAMAPNGNLWAASILDGVIGEFRLDAPGTSVAETLVRTLLQPPPGDAFPFSTGSPQGLAVDSQGNLYYADLDLQGTFPAVGPGPDGKLRVIRFDGNGDPLPPETIADGLAFPDGVGILPGDLPSTQWRTYAGGPGRRFFNAAESTITADNVSRLAERWRFRTGAIITGSPTVALLELPGEGPRQVAFFQSWDGFVYALRVADGSELWRFGTELQPGANFPNTASAHVEEIDGQTRVLIGSGHVFYALDALTGQEIWRFVAGTGCVDENGVPPGSCGPDGERNEIESSAIVADGTVVFGMDVNDRVGGKGGLYGLDAVDGRMRWFFDLESGQTCRPDPGEEIRQFDGYHDEAELDLPPGFLSTRSGCDFPRSRNGCGNVWSTPTWDADRGLLYVTSSNCDTDEDPASLKPPPPMPPYDEALFALDPDGNPVWRWRAYAVDNEDFAFGAAPNLFSIEIDGERVDVVGVGQKDGHYRVFDRDGVNRRNGIDCTAIDPVTGVVGCVDPAVGGGASEPAAFPGFAYWDTQVVPGGALGGIPLTAAVDEERRRVLFGTAPGFDPLAPQQPTLHALHMDTGEVVWDSLDFFPTQDASFAPTSAIPDVVFFGSVLQATLRAHKTTPGAPDEGAQLLNTMISPVPFGVAVASGPVVVDGTLLVGTGIGTRTGDPDDLSEITSRLANDLVALCVPGTAGCAACDDGVDNDGDGAVDGDDAGCSGPADLSERPDCMDAIDNDHDGLADWPLDPGCRNRLPRSQESPQCDDGVDNDGDGTLDFAPVAGTPDPECAAAWDESEAAGGGTRCGLVGLEVLAAWALATLRRRRRSRGRRPPALAAGLWALLAVWGTAGEARATPAPLAVEAQLAIRIADTTVFESAMHRGVVWVDAELDRLAVPDGLVATSGALPGATPAAAFSLVNASGTLRPGGAVTGTCPGPLGGAGACILGGALGGGLGGALPLAGALALGSPPVVLTGSVIGAGGIVSLSGVAVQGAPFTARTAAVTTTGTAADWTTAMGTAPASWLEFAGSSGSAPTRALVLVTPVHVALGEGLRAPVIVTLTFSAVPEPGSALLLGAGLLLGAIASAGRTRRG